MKVGVTGGDGFVGWHVRARLHLAGVETLNATRDTFANDESLQDFVGQSDVIIHAAAVNRADTDAEVSNGNLEPAQRLVAALDASGAAVPVLFTNSTQSRNAGVYGEAKAGVATVLRHHQAKVGAPYLDLILPHLFGEYGRPFYNSAVTTFAHCLATGETPQINRDGTLELLHVQDVATRVLAFIDAPTTATEAMSGTSITVGEAWDKLSGFHARYVDDFTVPDVADPFDLALFNTLRSQLYLTGFYPRPMVAHRDDRGAFSELCRADGLGQTSISTSVPGITRGDHFHLHKIERFIVLNGEATIRVRRVLTDDVQEWNVSGDELVYIDMPPLATHNITNTGSGTMTTMFWAADHFDPAVPDTYIDPVEQP